MSVLAQKNILVGVSGGIAAYKIPLLIRQLVKLKSNVKVVMTPSSKEFVTPLTLSTVSKNDVFSEFTTEKNNNPTWNNHVELAEWADIFIIAPATSNTISSMSSARCDNLLLACYLSSSCPVFVAPAMDLEMYKNTLNQTNIKKLVSECDLLIGGVLIPGAEAPKLVTKEMIKNMKSGSIIYDLAASQGGNTAFSEVNKIIDKNGVRIMGEKNILNKLPTSASNLYSKNLYNFVINLYDNENKKININLEDEIIEKTMIR